MKYRAISLAIVSIWLIAAIVIIVRADASPLTLLIYALVNTVILALFGFRSPSHPSKEA